MELYFSENLKKIDEESRSSFGYSENILMENAGSGCYRELLNLYGECRLLKAGITVVCGKGNNGGDGFVLSRYLFNSGFNVKTVILADRGSYAGTAKQNLDILINLGAEIVEVSQESGLSFFLEILDTTNILIDAIFGTGLSREIEGFLKTVVGAVNEKGGKNGLNENKEFDIICVDAPSGLNCDTGAFLGAGIKNGIKKIFTFGGLKVGFFVNEGEKLLLGEKATVIDINHPKKLLKKYSAGINLITEAAISKCFSGRKKTGTKFDYGHLLVVAGSSGKSGAAYMASFAGLKGGAGLVTAAVPSKLNDIMGTKTTEIMTYPVAGGDSGFFTESGASDISKNILKGKTAVVIGPGIGIDKETKMFLRRLIFEIKVPLVLDADALNILSEDMGYLKEISARTDVVLTPHFKEMERLSGVFRKDIESDPLSAGKKFTEEFGVYLVLKGPSMFIFDKKGRHISIQGIHSPLLASGGSGDILSGLIGSFICGGIGIYEAIRCAAFITAYSAKNLEGLYGDFGAGAVKIAENIPNSINLIRSGKRTADKGDFI